MNIIIIIRIGSNRVKERFWSIFWYAVLEKWIFENFHGYFYDDVIYKHDPYWGHFETCWWDSWVQSDSLRVKSFFSFHLLIISGPSVCRQCCNTDYCTGNENGDGIFWIPETKWQWSQSKPKNPTQKPEILNAYFLALIAWIVNISNSW